MGTKCVCDHSYDTIRQGVKRPLRTFEMGEFGELSIKRNPQAGTDLTHGQSMCNRDNQHLHHSASASIDCALIACPGCTDVDSLPQSQS